MKLCAIIRQKMLKISNNLFKPQILMYLTYVLGNISVFLPKLNNLITGITKSNYIIFHEIMCCYVAKKFQKVKQLI
jgi:hypothetical protein